MAEHSKAGPTCLSASSFLATLEQSGVLPDSKWRELRARFPRMTDFDDALGVAHELVEDGTLTEFQARRLLQGKKGLVVGRYALLDYIGKGARGRVFKARHLLMNRVVALKVILPDLAVKKGAVSRFFREMRIVGLLDHPNVVRAIDADVHEGCPYIVMEYLQGDDLGHLSARHGLLPPDEVIDYMAQAARGLAHAHEQGVIHRDVKPTNLLRVKTGIVKLLDLGCGELVGMAGQADNIFDTDEGVVVGTIDFMSPEQVKDTAIDARSDLFSLGCTMYRLLTGAYAFPGETREDRLLKRIREQHVPIAEVRPGLSDGLVAIVNRLLAVLPDDRFDSAAEVADALESLIPPAARSDRASSAKPRTHSPAADVASIPAEPEAPLDYSLIESALRPTGRDTRKAPSLVDQKNPKSPSTKGLSSHRKVLEDEGIESGRDVHKKYRDELIQLNRVTAQLRSMEPADEATAADATWLERIGETLGDALAEPSAAQILFAILAVLLVLAAALAFALR